MIRELFLIVICISDNFEHQIAKWSIRHKLQNFTKVTYLSVSNVI